MADYDGWDDQRGATRRGRQPEHREEGPYRERGFSRPPRIGPTGMMSQSWTGESGTSGRYYEDVAERADYGGYGGGEAGYGSRRIREAPRAGRQPYAGRDRERSWEGYGYEGGERSFASHDDIEMERRIGGPYTDYGRAFSGYGAGGGYTPEPGEGIGRGQDRSFRNQASDEVRSWFGDEAAARRRDRDDYRADAGHRGRGPKGYVRSDERIREDVSDRLTDDAIVDASDVDVLVQGGEVTLNGFVDSRTAKRRAEDCAEDVMGARHVQNNLRVRETPKPGTIGAETDPRLAAVSEGKDEADAAKGVAH
jgi:osmotically-inducible protein OsmY